VRASDCQIWKTTKDPTGKAVLPSLLDAISHLLVGRVKRRGDSPVLGCNGGVRPQVAEAGVRSQHGVLGAIESRAGNGDRSRTY